ncbi:glycoside hydrolase family 97 protein [Niabella drilacis]|uniref:Alpha-glucosidase n=1 Tax=Niabella drilacis (strain DSM 25811 / CCM 8410 / CCUG 62505 / LMG 26954 / E90) TaxID=1285928 RepID=A0A1G6R2S3_NIADE|nr:glycoside hydrolase family 97 protein [Niabella drilacis]SDC98355.1 alpha-glucosidase [Niabella drilacis]
MRNCLYGLFVLILHFNAGAQRYQLQSPGLQLTAEIAVDQRNIRIRLTKGGEELVQLDNPGLNIRDQKVDFNNRQVKGTRRRSVNETVRPVIREKSAAYANRYNELVIDFKGGYTLALRLFNEGLAYRFLTAVKDSMVVLSEQLSLHFAEGDTARFQASESISSAYETPYETKPVSGITSGRLCNFPFLVQKSNGRFVMITESDLYNYPGLWLTGTGTGRLEVTNPAYPQGLDYSGSIYNQGQVKTRAGFIARVSGSRSFPWRIIAVADNEEALISNNMVYLLASPQAPAADFSWVKPGVVLFDWWAKNNIYGVDFKSGINTATAKYFIDFCAAHGFRYFLFDDGWCPKENILKEVPELNMPEVVAYAKTKGVGILLWVIWSSMEKQMDAAFDLYAQWGIRGIKMDFMNRDDQPMVAFYEKVARKAAEKKMLVNFHGAYKPCGLRRQYPNVLTREALIEFEYNGWTRLDNPVHHNLLPYIRMFTGPMDYIPGTMRNATRENFRTLGDYPMMEGTRAHSMALFVILNSPMTMLPDAPSDYEREKECTDFLARIPVTWDETRLLAGKIGQYTALARRNGNNWFVGAITDTLARNLELKMDFLPPGSYKITIIRDGINADKRAEDYLRTETVMEAGSTLKLDLAPGGGWVARIEPL